jgi:hypothetical protein
LAIPWLIALAFIELGVGLVLIFGWFAALIIGRAPTTVRRAATYLLEVTLRTTAYLYLLTDQYPPSSEGAYRYPVQVLIPSATKLNRWAVLFRIFLAIPAAIVSILALYGLVIMAFFFWLITLISGRMPLSAHDALRAAIRYQTRLNAYTFLLVPTYPSALLGDVTSSDPWAPPQGLPRSASSPAWTLRLGTGARRLLIIGMVIAIPVYIGQIVLESHLITSIDPQAKLDSAVNTLNGNFVTYASNAQGCNTAANRVACAEGLAHTLSLELTSFADTISTITGTDASQSGINAVVTSARQAARIYNRLANAGPTLSDYQLVVSAVNLQSTLDTLQSRIDAL